VLNGTGFPFVTLGGGIFWAKSEMAQIAMTKTSVNFFIAFDFNVEYFHQNYRELLPLSSFCCTTKRF
jgi:hypothetical protein